MIVTGGFNRRTIYVYDTCVLLIWIKYHPMFKSSDTAYLKPSIFNNISLNLGFFYGLRFNLFLKFIKFMRKCN